MPWYFTRLNISFSEFEHFLDSNGSYDVWNHGEDGGKVAQADGVCSAPLSVKPVLIDPLFEAGMSSVYVRWGILAFKEIADTLLVSHIFEKNAYPSDIENHYEVANNRENDHLRRLFLKGLHVSLPENHDYYDEAKDENDEGDSPEYIITSFTHVILPN